MITILAGILMLLILVVVHELGHMIAARACGVGVEQFSVGFGPGLKMFTIKGIPFYFRFIPLGGFVKLKEKKLTQTFSQGKCLEEANWKQKIWIFLAGVTFNLVLAFLLRTVIHLFGPLDVQINLLSVTIPFSKAPYWYLAPLYALRSVVLLFSLFYFGILIGIWRLILPILTLTPIPQGGIGGTIGLGTNIHLGFWPYLSLIYFVSIIVAALNLLPFLPFDGGYVAVTLIQKIFGQNRFSKIFCRIIAGFGVVILLLIFINIIMSDLSDLGLFLKH